ncbi:hypothetical protein HK100_008314, partial [Physocladia obscura]
RFLWRSMFGLVLSSHFASVYLLPLLHGYLTKPRLQLFVPQLFWLHLETALLH